jgi:hypothetical protein
MYTPEELKKRMEAVKKAIAEEKPPRMHREEPDEINTDLGMPLEELLKHPAMTAKLEELENIWAVKFEDAWVTWKMIDKSEDPTFWDIARQRLKNSNRIETFEQPETFGTVYRLCR